MSLCNGARTVGVFKAINTLRGCWLRVMAGARSRGTREHRNWNAETFHSTSWFLFFNVDQYLNLRRVRRPKSIGLNQKDIGTLCRHRCLGLGQWMYEWMGESSDLFVDKFLGKNTVSISIRSWAVWAVGLRNVRRVRFDKNRNYDERGSKAM